MIHKPDKLHHEVTSYMLFSEIISFSRRKGPKFAPMTL